MRLVPLGLQPFLGSVWGVDGTEVHGSRLGTNAVEYPLPLVSLSLSVHLNLNDISGHILDYDTKGVCEAALRIGTDDMDLSTGDTESPKTSSETFSGPTKSRLDLLGKQE